MKHLILGLAAILVVTFGPTHLRAQSACYHCAWATDGSAFCHPISSDGWTACQGKIRTQVLPPVCEFSGNRCSNTSLDVAPDGAVLAMAGQIDGASSSETTSTVQRRDCDGAIVRRQYAAAEAARLRAASRRLNL